MSDVIEQEGATVTRAAPVAADAAPKPVPAKPEPVKLHDKGFDATTMDDLMRIANVMHRTGLYSKYNEGEVFGIICKGRQLGLQPDAALSNIALIKGKYCVYGDGLIGAILGSGLLVDMEERIEGEGEDMVAVCRVNRKDWPTPHEVRFSMKDAAAAGLSGSQTWRAYPKRMLQMRARSWAIRDRFADVLGGVIQAEEAEDYPVETRQVANTSGRRDLAEPVPAEMIDD